MKKLLILTCSLLLVLACQKEANDLVVDSDLTLGTGAANLPAVASINPAAYGEIVDQYTTPAGIQGKIEVTFSDYMDQASVTSLANITLLNTTTGTEVSAGITTEYFPDLRKLYIYIDPVPADGKYLLRLASGGMVNTYGQPLDFDGDNAVDGAYDDYLVSYWTQAANADTFVIPVQPTITAFSPDTIATNNTQPFIAITFTGGMDTLTLSTGNITLTNTSGAPQALNLISRSANSVVLQPASALPMAANYTITVKCDNIKRLGDHATPAEYLKLDGNDDGPGASEPDLQSIFRVDDPTLPPRLNSVAAIGTSGALFTFSRLIDEATISKTTIAVYDNSGYVPGEFRIYTDAGNTYTMVEYYFHRTTGGGRHAWVSKDLKGQNLYFFDGDNNGIGGEPWDNRDVAF